MILARGLTLARVWHYFVPASVKFKEKINATEDNATKFKLNFLIRRKLIDER